MEPWNFSLSRIDSRTLNRFIFKLIQFAWIDSLLKLNEFTCELIHYELIYHWIDSFVNRFKSPHASIQLLLETQLSIFDPVSLMQIYIDLWCLEIHWDKPTSLIMPDAPLPHDFRSTTEFTWYTRFFHTRKIIVKRALNNTWSQQSSIPFFLTRLLACAS